MKSKNNLILKISVTTSYLAMITVNILANALPIAGKNTGAVSDSYPNLFAPAGITFSIWGLIYLLLAAYVIYYLAKKSSADKALAKKIGQLFVVSSLANIAWIFSWHYGYLAISVIIMLIILISLKRITSVVSREKLNVKDRLFLSLPFSIYLGWISVATIANITAFLVDLNWSGWGITEPTWTIVILIIGALIAIIRGHQSKSIPYLLVFTWAYFGIWVKHNSVDGFNGQYPTITITALLAIALFVLNIVYIGIKERRII